MDGTESELSEGDELASGLGRVSDAVHLERSPHLRPEANQSAGEQQQVQDVEPSQ